MTDLSKFSTDQLADMLLKARWLRLNFVIMAARCDVDAERFAKEIERRKEQGDSTP